MLTTIRPSALSGVIQAPASKSSMQRACAAALLRVGETIIRHPGHSNDDRAALGVIRDLGAEVVGLEDGSIRVTSEGVKASKGLEVNCGESGLGLRMFAPIIGLSRQTIRVRGEGSLLNRPMDFFDEVFPQLGIRVVSNKGKLPLEIQGPLQPRDIEIDGSLVFTIFDRFAVRFLCCAGERCYDPGPPAEEQAVYRSYAAGDEAFRMACGESGL